MTTGRINQVTTFQMRPPPGGGERNAQYSRPLTVAFPVGSFHLTVERLGHSYSLLSAQERTCVPKPATEPPCSPVSHISSALLPVAVKQQRSWPSERTTNNRHSVKERRTVAADSRVASCNRFSYQQVIHILLSLRTPEVLDLWRQERNPEGAPFTSQAPSYSESVYPDSQARR